jgi:hypothetical protein
MSLRRCSSTPGPMSQVSSCGTGEVRTNHKKLSMTRHSFPWQGRYTSLLSSSVSPLRDVSHKLTQGSCLHSRQLHDLQGDFGYDDIVIDCPVVNGCLFVAYLVLFAWRPCTAALLCLECLSCWGTILHHYLQTNSIGTFISWSRLHTLTHPSDL